MPGRAASPSGPAGQALVEVALVLPLLLLLALGVVGASRVAQAQLGVAAVAREAARAAALADTAAEARERGLGRGQDVAAGYRLDNGTLALGVDPGPLERGGRVRAWASYRVGFEDLPFLQWTELTVERAHAERVDLYRSRWRGDGP